MSNSTEGYGECQSRQTVWVVSGETYTASVYVKGWDHTTDSTGFGMVPGLHISAQRCHDGAREQQDN